MDFLLSAIYNISAYQSCRNKISYVQEGKSFLTLTVS